MFNPRELATVLAALRLWQQQLSKDGIELTNSYPRSWKSGPLSVKQIDRLCEQLNEPATRQLASSLRHRSLRMSVPDLINLFSSILTSH